ncbi:hypothetical protein MTO96_016218 [Rhipicephalus appendiculatus]
MQEALVEDYVVHCGNGVTGNQIPRAREEVRICIGRVFLFRHVPLGSYVSIGSGITIEVSPHRMLDSYQTVRDDSEVPHAEKHVVVDLEHEVMSPSTFLEPKE